MIICNLEILNQSEVNLVMHFLPELSKYVVGKGHCHLEQKNVSE